MKNAVKLLLCTLLCLMMASYACARNVECAGKLVEMESFEHYPSYTCDEETGKWSVQAYQDDALMDRFWEYGMRSSSRMVVFHLAAEGDARTGVWTPVLRFYHIDGGRINARAVSILVDGRRYDLAASSESVVHKRHTAECITVPLNAQGMQVAYAMQQAEQVTIRLIGDDLHTLKVDRTASSDRQAVEGASLVHLTYGMALLDELGADSYALWDLSAAAWEKEYGYEPAVTVGSVGDTLLDQRMTDAMGMILPDDSTDAAEAAQEKLIEHGFLSGSAYWKLDDKAVEAVLRAQKVLGRVPTGCVDQALLDALALGRAAETAEEPELISLGEGAQLALERYWFADGVSASASDESLRMVINADNTFLAADGSLRNLSAEELHLFMQMEASVFYNGRYAYEAELVCEVSDGAALDTRLLPMAQARLLVFAEIPASLAADEEAEWSISFELNGETLLIDLK